MIVSKYRRWTSEEDKLLKKLYNKKTLVELGEIFNRNWNKVCRRAIILGVKKDKDFISKRISQSHKELFKKGIRSNKGDKNPNWKGGVTQECAGIDSKLYSSIHWWLFKQYGKADKCENKDCLGISKNYTWSKIKGKEYKKIRSHFKMLCKSCHTKYDKKAYAKK